MGEKGIIVSGEYGNLLARQRSGEQFELGELLIAISGTDKLLLQVFDLAYGSQLNQQHLELVSGLQLEDSDIRLLDEERRQYILARLKNVLTIGSQGARSAKTLPQFFSRVRPVRAEDVQFLSKRDPNSLYLGELRSGSATLDVPVYVDAPMALSHHLLIAGTTGRGKSVLMSNLLWDATQLPSCAMLVLDPHNEYYGSGTKPLRDLDGVIYYSIRPPATGNTLAIHLALLRPRDFSAVAEWTSAQTDCMNAYYTVYHHAWIENILLERPLEHYKFNEATAAVVKRRLLSLLSLSIDNGQISSRGAFHPVLGKTTVTDIINHLTQGRTVIIDTSPFSGAVEVLIASILANAALSTYKRKAHTEREHAPVINIVLEEAPRVLGKDILERGPNVFSTIAREGRKFRIGLTAITQLPSLIPRQVLANLNTKIILGIELKPERQAIIESAAQDLSEDNRMIASLDKGEAIVSSTFLRFATPIKIPLRKTERADKPARDFGAFQ